MGERVGARFAERSSANGTAMTSNPLTSTETQSMENHPRKYRPAIEDGEVRKPARSIPTAPSAWGTTSTNWRHMSRRKRKLITSVGVRVKAEG